MPLNQRFSKDKTAQTLYRKITDEIFKQSLSNNRHFVRTGCIKLLQTLWAVFSHQNKNKRPFHYLTMSQHEELNDVLKARRRTKLTNIMQ